MEPLEVIDLSSDDENSPPRTTVRDEKKKVFSNNKDDDIKILANVVRKRKRPIDHVNHSGSPSKRIKNAKNEDPSNVLTNLLHKKPEISVQKIITKRIKPETLSPLSTSHTSVSKPATEIRDKNNLKTCYNDVTLFKNDTIFEKKKTLPNSEKNCHSFKINEGASSSTKTNIPQLTVMNTVKVSEVVDDITTPSTEALELFFEACRSRDPGKEMEIIISKFRKRYSNLEPPYAKSGSFIQLLRNKKNLILCNKSKLYLHISEVMDEMKAKQIKKKTASREKKQRSSLPLAHVNSNQRLSDIPEEDAGDEKDSEYRDIRDQERLESLDKAMRRCERLIIKCEEAEVDFDDENDSNYIMAEKYKERMVQLYNKYCEITGQIADAARPYLRPKNLDVTPLATLNNAITSFINMKITKMNRLMVTTSRNSRPPNLTDALIFPDYEDVLDCVKKCNEEENLQLNRNRVADIAKTAFSELGRYLQRCRHMDYYDTFSLYLEKGDRDPASDDETLAQKLRENQELGKKKLDQVFQEYVEKQNAAKEEATNGALLEKEGDSQSADESSDGSDDEDYDSPDGKTIYDSDDTEYDRTESKLRDDAKPKSINEAELSDNHTDNEELTENKLSKKNHHASHESLAVKETVEKSDSLDTKQSTEIITSELCTEEVAEYSNEGMDIDTSEVSKGSIGDDVASNDDMDTIKPSEEKDSDDVEITKEKNVDDVASNNDMDTSKSSEEKDLDDVEITKEKYVDDVASNNDMDTSKSSEEKDLDDVEITKEKYVDDVASNNDTDTSKRSEEKDVDDVQIAKEKNVETILLQSSVRKTETKDGARKVVAGVRTAGSNSTNTITSPQSPIQKATSTVATCKLNLVENSQPSEMKVMDKRSPLIAATEAKVRDTPAMAISMEAVDKDEETRPKLRLRPFAKPPGSWEDFQSLPKTSVPETQATRITDKDTESEKINKPTERDQNRFIKINKPTQIGKMVQVTKDVFINLTNKSSTVLIPPNAKRINPQINVKTVTNNVTVNFNNPSQFPTKVTAIAPKNLIKINDSGKIIRYANVGVINTTTNKDKVVAGSTTTPSVKYKNQMIPIRNTTHQVRLVGPQATGTSKVPRPVSLNPLQKRPIVSQVPVIDKNTTEKLYRIMKRPLGANPQNISVPVVTTGVQNQMPRSSNQRPNSNLIPVTVSNVKMQISNSIKSTAPSKLSRPYTKKDDKVYETSNDGVPTYLID